MTGMTARRLLGAGIVALVLGGLSGTAVADTFWERSESRAGPGGASLKIMRAYAGDDGRVLFEELHYTAGPDGAKVYRTVSGAGGNDGAAPVSRGARQPAGASGDDGAEPIPLRARKPAGVSKGGGAERVPLRARKAGTQKAGTPRR
ncbi:hypothetical protein [Planobispora longispora]|uniref:Uncharacterized protein n=1 Tax=Planobispora longispora TaxID=28887 RepID=A0A8J3RNN6_9ACTN|nr:hypothetical protein [Planobispora longispora]GIH77451.1 hypothetical protein Plo01_38800 [Planobispora longispora]